MKLSNRRREPLEINLTALIDIVFLLLIFFMVTTTFERHSRLKIDLPEANEEAVAVKDDRLEIAITADGRIYINNNEVVNTTLATVRDALARQAGESRDQQVTIRADAASAHQHFVTAMNAVSVLGFTNLSIATTPSAD